MKNTPLTTLSGSGTVRRFLYVCGAALLAACGGGSGNGSSPGSLTQANESEAANSVAPSYHRDIRTILESKCVTCHREGGEAPFSLTEFDQVASLHSAMVYSLEAQSMPPAGYAVLTTRERELMLAWLDQPALLEGSPEQDKPSTSYTWWRDTSSIVRHHCSSCHVEDGLAPFPLQSYEDIVAIQAAAHYSIANNTMPPWNPSNGYTELQHNLSLTREDKAVLLDWLQGGAPEGNPAHEVELEPEGLEEVDWELSLQMPVAYTPTIYPDEYRCFVVDWPKTETRYITASNFLPKFAAQIHHVFVTIIPPASVDDYKAAEQLDDNPGYTCFGDTRIPGELPTSPPSDVLGWGPGINSKRLPQGTGILIEPGSALALQIHFNTLTSDPMPEQSRLQFVTEPAVERPGATAYILDISNWVFSGNMLIPAGEDDVSFQYEMPVSELKGIFNRPELGIGPQDPIAIQRASLHMHTLGKSSRLSLVRADGTEQVILDAQNWDFDWQNKYLLEQEVIVQPEDRIRTQCVYDNTPENQPVVNGAALPVRDVRWGDGTTDEMCASTLFFTAVDQPHHPAPRVYIGRPEVLERFAPGDLMPVELRLNNFVLEPPQAHDNETHHNGTHHGQLATRGHYHIYFDTDDDSAEHITQWLQQPVIKVPDDMTAGIHRLRVSLRSSNHEAVGVEDSIEFHVVNPADDADKDPASPLIDHQLWAARSAAGDPIAEHRPDSIDCPVSTWGPEGEALEVETGACNYLALQQPSLAGISQGDSIRLVLWHQQLRNEEPGRGHVALGMGGDILWQKSVAIPNDGGFYDVEFTAGQDYPAGTTIDFHLHNHGYNSWTLLTVEQIPAR